MDQTMWSVIVGGLLAIAGGFLATWLQAKYARKIKMDEIVAEKTVAANTDGYAHIKKISSMMDREKPDQALHFIISTDEWLFRNRLFLSGKFPDKWLTIRNSLYKIKKLEEGSEEDRSKIPELLKALKATAAEAGDEIYKEMGLKRIEVEDLSKRTS